MSGSRSIGGAGAGVAGAAAGVHAPDRPDAGAAGGLVLLRLGPAEFALPIAAARQVLRAPIVTRLPHPRHGVVGVFALRGAIVPALDLGLLLRRSPAIPDASVVVVRNDATGDEVGLLVDAVTGIADERTAERLDLPPEAEASVPAGWATGLAVLGDGRIATLLDPATLLFDTSHRPAAHASGTEFAKETG